MVEGFRATRTTTAILRRLGSASYQCDICVLHVDVVMEENLGFGNTVNPRKLDMNVATHHEQYAFIVGHLSQKFSCLTCIEATFMKYQKCPQSFN